VLEANSVVRLILQLGDGLCWLQAQALSWQFLWQVHLEDRTTVTDRVITIGMVSNTAASGAVASR